MLSLATLAFVLALGFGAGAYVVTRIDGLDHRATLVVVVVGLAVGGVAVGPVPADPVERPATATAAATSGDGPSEPAATVGGPSAAVERRVSTATAATNVSATNAANATVVDAVTGDRLVYRTAGGARRTVRLAGIDAPGVDGADPERFDGVVTGSRGRTCLADYGRRALLDVRELVDESVGIRTIESGTGLDRVVLTADGRSINRRLVERGYARATADRYADAERAARSAERGVWSCATVEPTPPLRESNEPDVRIAAVHPNPPGDDAAALTDEYVVLENVGEVTVDLTGWYLVDGDGHAYFFADGRELPPGAELVVHVGRGRDTDGHAYWGSSSPVLDNDHETLKLVGGESDRTIRLSY